MEKQPHEAFADAVREAVVGGAVAVAGGQMPELAITIKMAQTHESKEHGDDNFTGAVTLSVEFDPPLTN